MIFPFAKQDLKGKQEKEKFLKNRFLLFLVVLPKDLTWTHLEEPEKKLNLYSERDKRPKEKKGERKKSLKIRCE